MTKRCAHHVSPLRHIIFVFLYFDENVMKNVSDDDCDDISTHVIGWYFKVGLEIRFNHFIERINNKIMKP